MDERQKSTSLANLLAIGCTFTSLTAAFSF
jgi:hypothetical protein